MSNSDSPIYLDNNATTPLDPRVLEAMMPYLTDRFGNAASQTHRFGLDAAEAVQRARRQIADLIGAQPREIVFTSGATESTNLALKGMAETATVPRHFITASTEHKATLDTMTALSEKGHRITILPVDGEGRLDLEALAEAVCEDTLAVSLMAANNEIGVMHSVRRIGELCREKGVFFHTDAAQAFGKTELDVKAMKIDLMSVSGHKIYGPKGVGFLFARQQGDEPQPRLHEQINGGGHEGHRRSGTLNVPGIVGLGEAARIAGLELEEERSHARELRDHLLSRLENELGDIRVNGALEDRLEGNLNVSFQGVPSDALMMALSGIAVSSGSACDSETIEPSYVLKAIGLDDDRALGAIRFGIGRFNTQEEIDRAADEVVVAVTALRQMA